MLYNVTQVFLHRFAIVEKIMDSLERLEQRVKDLEDEKKKFFRTGVIVLGSLVLSLLGYIWIIKVG